MVKETQSRAIGGGTGDPYAQIERLEDRCAQLQRALESRVVIEQAKGAVAARRGVSLEEAFELVRGLARSQRREIHEFCVEVVANRGRLDGNGPVSLKT
jgi:AmiR/NasT family two-component response regulator